MCATANKSHKKKRKIERKKSKDREANSHVMGYMMRIKSLGLALQMTCSSL